MTTLEIRVSNTAGNNRFKSVGESIQINSAERTKSNSHQIQFVWPSAKPVPTVLAYW